MHPLLAGACLAAIVLGVALRLLSFHGMELWQDGHRYAVLGHMLAERGALVLPWGDGATLGTTPSHHYPPLYPAYLALAYELGGFGAATTKAAGIAVSLAALLATYLAARDLLGEPAGRLAGALAALDPHLLWVTGTGFSENLVLLLFAVTLWAIFKSLEAPRWMVLAGLAAGLAYLTRSSAGSIFVLMGLAGLAWRVHHRGARGTLGDRAYVVAIAVFGALVLAWAWRNVHVFGWPHWETSAYVAAIQRCILVDVLGACGYHGEGAWGRFLLALAAKAPLFLLFAALWAVPLWPELRRSLRHLGREWESGAWLAALLVLATGWIVAAMFWAAEATHLWWPENRRYVAIALLPLALAAARHADWRDPGLARRVAALLAVLGLLAVAVFAVPPRFPENDAAAALGGEGPGLVVGLDARLGRYDFYAALHPGVERVCPFSAVVGAEPGCDAEFLLTDRAGHDACYAALGFAERPDLGAGQAYRLPGWPAKRVAVWERIHDRAPDLATCAGAS